MTSDTSVGSGGVAARERDIARRLHAAAIASGKAEAELERLPREGQPVAFRMRALAKAAQAQIAWLRIYFEAVEYFQSQSSAALQPKGHSDG